MTMTWKEFKELVEGVGVSDEDKLTYIITDDNPSKADLEVNLNEDKFYVCNK